MYRSAACAICPENHSAHLAPLRRSACVKAILLVKMLAWRCRRRAFSRSTNHAERNGAAKRCIYRETVCHPARKRGGRAPQCFQPPSVASFQLSPRPGEQGERPLAQRNRSRIGASKPSSPGTCRGGTRVQGAPSAAGLVNSTQSEEINGYREGSMYMS